LSLALLRACLLSCLICFFFFRYLSFSSFRVFFLFFFSVCCLVSRSCFRVPFLAGFPSYLPCFLSCCLSCLLPSAFFVLASHSFLYFLSFFLSVFSSQA